MGGGTHDLQNTLVGKAKDRKLQRLPDFTRKSTEYTGFYLFNLFYYLAFLKVP